MWTLEQLQAKNAPMTYINNKWVSARPINYTVRTFKEKVIEAYKVFIGEADAMIWPEGQ